MKFRLITRLPLKPSDDDVLEAILRREPRYRKFSKIRLDMIIKFGEGLAYMISYTKPDQTEITEGGYIKL
jgi:hypothetical protein